MTAEEFSERVEKMIPTLYRICVSQLRQPCDREDAVQAALERAWRRRETLKEEKYFETWLIRILLNECHNLQRLRSRESGAELPEIGTEKASGRSDLKEALSALENKWRIPILLHYIEGYGMREIARMLSVPQGTVQSRLKRGREKLKELLSEEVFGNEETR